MAGLSLKEVLDATQGTLVQKGGDLISAAVKQVSTDSRNIQGGELFFALSGEHFDGHDFVQDALAGGACGAVVRRGFPVQENLPSGGFLICVDSPLTALQELAAYRRKKLKLTVVGITGSTGKTTTKDMTASVLEQKYNVGKTRGNFNNQIGLPLTLLGLDEDTEVAVLEMGMSAEGEIARLAEIASPEIGIVLNVGRTHIAFLRTIENIARAKSELICALPEEGTAILNADDNLVRKMSERTRADVIYFGIESDAVIKASQVQITDQQQTRFLLTGPGGRSTWVELPVPGRHLVYNALAAAGAGFALGLDFSQISSGLESFQLTGMRIEIKSLNGIMLINDSYNASPASMRAGIDLLVEMASERSIAVLGDMLELGHLAQSAHREIGSYLEAKGVDLLFLTGDLAGEVAEGAVKSGFCLDKIHIFKEKERLAQKLLSGLLPGDTVLIKASRGIKLEEVVQFIEGKLTVSGDKGSNLDPLK